MNLYFLKLDAVKGDSCAARHLGEIELTGFTWGDPNRAASAGFGPGKPSIDDITLFKKTDRTSNELLLASADGRHYKQATLTVEKVSGSGGLIRTTTVNMKSILINKFRASANPPTSAAAATEEIGLKFMQMELVDSENKEQ